MADVVDVDKEPKEGDTCPACGVGHLEIHHIRSGGCTCFISAPCSWCVDTNFRCSACGEDYGDTP